MLHLQTKQSYNSHKSCSRPECFWRDNDLTIAISFVNASSTNAICRNECGTVAKFEAVDLRHWHALPDQAPLLISIFQMKPNLDNTISRIDFGEAHVTSLAPITDQDICNSSRRSGRLKHRMKASCSSFAAGFQASSLSSPKDRRSLQCVRQTSRSSDFSAPRLPVCSSFAHLVPPVVHEAALEAAVAVKLLLGGGG